MARSRLITAISVSEYLEAERDAEVRHEYVYGEVYAMAGGSVAHNVITGNIARVLGNAALAHRSVSFPPFVTLSASEGSAYPAAWQADASASPQHDKMADDFWEAVLATDCRVYASDMKVRVEGELFYYPDVMVVCEPPADDYYEAAPCVIVEVVSGSTSRKDRMEKRFGYLMLDSLRLYLLVDSRRRAVTGFSRTPSGWEERVYSEGDSIPIPCLDVPLTFADIYHKALG